ncbi:MAG TPA: rhodanese-like domain-containing protein [Acidimicrobiales bacterium]|nr:rhodanese-like domain-containing protein [Acidimicrobiales bacterium]
MYRDIETSELAARLGAPDSPFLVDVREPDEFAAWSIPTAVNIPVGELAARIGEVATDREIVTVCASGSRSAVAAETLSRAGRHVANLAGGMQAWSGTYDSITLELDDVRIVQVRRRGKGCLSYLVGSGDRAFVIDPSADIDVYRRLAEEHGWVIARVFDTHLHADHLSGARALAAATGAALHLNPADTFDFPFEPVGDGDRFELPGGSGLTVAVLGTPGHTRGSTVYLVNGRAALTGDTLFVDSVGRPDLADQAEAFAGDLYDSLHGKLLGLADDLLVLPGHYGDGVVVRADREVGAPLGQLRRELSALSFDRDSFVTWAAARSVDRPPNYTRIIEANMGRASDPLAVLRQFEAGPNRCAVSS